VVFNKLRALLTIRRKSDVLLMFLLKKLQPAYRDKAKVQRIAYQRLGRASR